MERLMVVNTFQKSIDALKTTECSQKEKIQLFTQITECIQSSTLRVNVSYLNHVGSAISILLMFCEELDADVRVSAEENLNKIIRFLSTTHIVRIQYDLFHEIKRNGNERSLRIALNIFAHYIQLIHQRKIKPYALNLLPCILAISHRKEQQLIETLSAFIQKFCKYLQIGLNENEVSNLIEIFVKDATGTECSVKRRCSAANVMALIEYSRRPDVMSKHALTICLGMLVSDFTMNTIIGAMGFLRVLLPRMLSSDRMDIQVIHKVIEIYEICLHLLSDKNHSIINASLECVSVILSNAPIKLIDYLTNENMKHMEILCKRKSLKNQIFRRKSSNTSSEQLDVKHQFFASPKSKARPKGADNSVLNESELLNETSVPFDDKSLLTGSDVECDSFRATDTDGEKGFDSPARTPLMRLKQSKDSDSLKSPKSADSVGAFFNTILSSSNTESVTKFFRVGSSSQPTPDHLAAQQSIEQHTDSDNISVHSGNSIMSLNSQNSSALSTFDIVNKTDDSIPEIEILNDLEIAAIKLESDAEHFKSEDVETTLDATNNQSINIERKDISIGSIRDQPLVYYTVRLISSKFLLYGEPSQLIDDLNVRISIKNTSLIVISHCVDLCANTLCVQLQKNDAFHEFELDDEHFSDSDEDSIGSNAIAASTPMKSNASADAGDQLNIKDDHFGENSKVPGTYFDFCSGLSKSADNVLLQNLYPGSYRAKKVDKLNSDLSDLLSKSEIIEFKSTLTDDKSNLNVDLKELESCLYRPSADSINLSHSQQLIEDLLLYWNHSDPVLRTNIQFLIGNFIANVLRNADSVEEFISINGITKNFRFLNINNLLNILLKGLSDNIHSVVKQSLSSLEKIVSILLDHRIDWFLSCTNSISPAYRPPAELSLDCIAFNDAIQLLHRIFDTILLVFDNKYWVVQNKYCRFIATINYGALNQIIGCDSTDAYKARFVSHIYAMLSEVDLRIRTEAINALNEYILCQSIRYVKQDRIADKDVIIEFIGGALVQDVPFLLKTANQSARFILEMAEKQAIEQAMGKCLFDLTNLMFELGSREQLLGVTKCIAKLIETFNPLQWLDIWLEFNVLEVSLALLTSNYNTGTDLSCQCDLITICVNILTASALKTNAENSTKNAKTNATVLMSHIMKIMNIYWHILTEKRPVFVSKSRKSDIFANSKEIQLINSHSYFGNDYFYLKIYKMLRIIYENFKISISSEIDAKLFGLMEVCLSALAMLLDIVEFISTTEMTTFISEMLTYIRAMVTHMPQPSIVCIKQLIKLMFSMNYRNRQLEKNLYDLRKVYELSETEIFEYFDSFQTIVTVPAKRPVETTPSKSTLINFLASTPEKSTKFIEAGNIKIFEPLVIQCLKLFTKSNSAIQAAILNMLCHVLQLKVNYCLLDAKGVFIGLIMKLIESIEMGNIRDSHLVTPNIITFLFHLARQRENPQMSIPKIINITDNLLANSITNNGSIEALCQLAYEIYFPTNIQDPDNIAKIEINERDIYTQKEVVFSMLLKFIDATIVKKTICVILMKDGEKLGEINREICESLLNVFDDKKPIIHSLMDYWCLQKITDRTRTTFIREKAIMTRLKSRLLRHREMNFVDDVAVKTIILNGIPEVVNIFFESPDSDSYQQSHDLNFTDYIYQTLNHFTTFNYSDYNNFHEMHAKESLQYLQIFTDYLEVLSKLWISNCANQASRSDKNIFNENFAENAMNFLRKMSTIQKPPTIELSDRFSIVKSLFTKTIFTFILTFCGKNVLFGALRSNGAESVSYICDPLTQRYLLHTLSTSLDTANEIEFILKNHFIKMLSVDATFIINASTKRPNIELILSELRALSKQNASNKEILWIFLAAIENSDIESLPTILKHLSEQIFDDKALYYKQSPILRRAFHILNEKLQEFAPSDDANPQMELYESIVSEPFITTLRQFQRYKWHEQYATVEKSIESIINMQESKETKKEIFSTLDRDGTQNEDWFLNQIIDAISSKTNKQTVCQLLIEVKNESKLRKVVEASSDQFDESHLNELIECSFRSMSVRFMQDCFSHNAHINYLKISPSLKLALNILNDKIVSITSNSERNNENPDIFQIHGATIANSAIFAVTRTFLRNIVDLLYGCLVYVEAASIQKFFIDHFFSVINFERLVQLSFLCLNYINESLTENGFTSFDDVLCACDCIAQIINVHALFMQSDNYYTGDKCNTFFEALVDVSYRLVHEHLAERLLIQRNSLASIVEHQNRANRFSDEMEMRYAKAIFLGKFIEQHAQVKWDQPSQSTQASTRIIVSLVIAALRNDAFYFFGITPHEIVQSFDWQLNSDVNNKLNRLPCIPIDCLNEAEVIERFVCRINIIGFPSRQFYEELFMSLLLLMNQENDSFVVDKQEEYQIKNVCLMAIIELLLSCKMYPVVGDRLNSMFHHVPRLLSPKSDSIGIKKLHAIQSVFLHQPNVFYMPNAERHLTNNNVYSPNKHNNNGIGTHDFCLQQYDLNVLWHAIEGQCPALKSMNIELKNMIFFLEKSAIDLNSGIQLTFDVITQSLEANYMQMLPHMTKFCELCENRDQFHWIKNTMIRLQESVPMDNALSHQYIIYCVCKSYAVLIPSIHDLNHLCTLINNYLKSSHLFVRVAALNGLLILFESCIKTNTTIGSLSEEVLHLRSVILNYITKHIVNEETLEHSMLVWTLNFYLIETTSRYVTDCNLIPNTIIAANHIVKKTTNVTLYSCIIHGLERIVITRTMTKFCHEKVERLALDLVKMENEQFSLLALKLLATCMYMGSIEQLENTERCNGIIQDEPEVIVQSIEKIEILFNRIKLATRPAAEIYGSILAQLIQDLVPPRDLLTKVIQELLTTSQPHCTIIARILYQIFRSAIDSSYLPLLQDWLLCSLPNFTVFPIEKTMWYLTAIFISSSINLDLIKIFPLILADYESICDIVSYEKLRKQTSIQSTSYDSELLKCYATRSHFNADRCYMLFVVACRDFYKKLNPTQKTTFRETFARFNESKITDMLKAL